MPYMDKTELWVAGKNKAMAFVGKWVELRGILNEVSPPRCRRQMDALCVCARVCKCRRDQRLTLGVFLNCFHHVLRQGLSCSPGVL